MIQENRVSQSSSPELRKSHLWVQVMSALALLHLTACSGDTPTAVPPTPTEYSGFIPQRTLCANYQDFITSQPDGKWTFHEVEIINGQAFVVNTVPNIFSQSEALGRCRIKE